MTPAPEWVGLVALVVGFLFGRLSQRVSDRLHVRRVRERIRGGRCRYSEQLGSMMWRCTRPNGHTLREPSHHNMELVNDDGAAVPRPGESFRAPPPKN